MVSPPKHQSFKVVLVFCLVTSEQMYPWASQGLGLPPLGSPLHPPLTMELYLTRVWVYFLEAKL